MAPIIVLSNPRMQRLTFFWKEHLRYWVGYRVVEDQPETKLRAIPEDMYWPVAG
jgi:hypothetical protein